MGRMLSLTRRRSTDAREKCWHVYYGDVHAGTIAIRDWTAEKYRRFDRGERMPPDWKPAPHPHRFSGGHPLVVTRKSGPARGESWTTRAGSDHSPLAREA